MLFDGDSRSGSTLIYMIDDELILLVLSGHPTHLPSVILCYSFVRVFRV